MRFSVVRVISLCDSYFGFILGRGRVETLDAKYNLIFR